MSRSRTTSLPYPSLLKRPTCNTGFPQKGSLWLRLGWICKGSGRLLCRSKIHVLPICSWRTCPERPGILKGLPYLLQAWSELNLENSKLQVCGEMGPEAKKLISDYAGRLKNVEFTGYVSNPEEYYRKSAVFVLPSLAEGLPRVVLEAMACGRPIITTPILKPVVRDGIDGVYIPMRDVQALKQKMLYFYNNREEVARMGANASERARLFTWERFSQDISQILSYEWRDKKSVPSLELDVAANQ